MLKVDVGSRSGNSSSSSSVSARLKPGAGAAAVMSYALQLHLHVTKLTALHWVSILPIPTSKQSFLWRCDTENCWFLENIELCASRVHLPFNVTWTRTQHVPEYLLVVLPFCILGGGPLKSIPDLLWAVRCAHPYQVELCAYSICT